MFRTCALWELVHPPKEVVHHVAPPDLWAPGMQLVRRIFIIIIIDALLIHRSDDCTLRIAEHPACVSCISITSHNTNSTALFTQRRGNRDPDHRRHNGRSGSPRDLDARRDRRRRRHSRHYRHGDCRHYGYRVRRPRTSRHGHSGGLAPPPRGWAVRCPRRAPPLRHRARVTP